MTPMSRRLLLSFRAFAIALAMVNLPASLHAQLTERVSEICHVVHPSGWVHFRDEISVAGRDVFDRYAQYFGLGPLDQMRLFRVTTDGYGFTHYRYQQYYDGVPVEHAHFTVQERDGRAQKANGRIAADLTISAWPVLSKQQALDRAIGSLPHGRPAWQDEASERFMRSIRADSSATQYPEPELVLTRVDDDGTFTEDNLVLAYRVQIATVDPIDRFGIYVNAFDGGIAKISRARTGCVDATATTLYNGDQSIKVSRTSSDPNDDASVLEATCDGTLIRTRSTQGRVPSNPPPAETEVLHEDLDWTDDAELNPFAQAHWSAMMTFRYFDGTFGYKGYDNNGAMMLQLVGGTSNLNWHQSALCVAVPDPDNFPAFFSNWGVSLDIIGHEWTHAMTYVVADVTTPFPTGEFGALFESFGDIFGQMVECYAKDNYDPNNQFDCEDYIIGEDCLVTTLQRNMVNPHAKNHPDTYCGTYWGDADLFHVRSGVQNRWFTLLAKQYNANNDPWTGTNNHCCSTASYSVTSIGKDKAAAIAFRNLRFKLGPWSNYVDAMVGSLEAADDLIAANVLTTGDKNQVKEAWKAVGVYENKVGFDFTRCTTYTSQSQETLLEAINTIRAGQVCGSGSTNLVESGAELTYVAGKQVRLISGFRAANGSEFSARIADPCTTFFPRAVKNEAKAGYPQSGQSPNEARSAPTVNIAPNPAQSMCKIWFGLPQSCMVRMVLVNQLGEVVRVIVDGTPYQAGMHQLVVPLNDLPSGSYVCRLEAGLHSTTTIMQVVR